MATMVEERQRAAAPRRRRLREISWSAWIWIAPALFLEILFFIYPIINTIQLSFYNKLSTDVVGFRNYVQIFTDPALLLVLRNNVLWLVLGTIATVGLG
ncbi:MAG: sugar ABC transporter permease, partial [Ktedonobacteraceae bacterium]|nr:sugar ABC transporter permease [Ktedonobacteraceae bacterium]